VNQGARTKQTKQGFEVEARTLPWHGLSLAGGYTFIDARDSITKERLTFVPSNGAKMSLQYDEEMLGLRGAITGNYVWWNRDPNHWSGWSDKGMIWDLHLSWQPFPKKELLSPELFFSGHNLFNGSQSVHTSIYNSAPRWFEGGMRVRF
jgi:vitamin B12 transporter